MTLRLRAVALAGTATVLAAGALVGAASTAAQATPAGTAYSCTIFGNTVPILVEGVAPTLNSPVAGKNVAAGSVPMAVNVGFTSTVADGIKSQTHATKVGFSSADFAVGLGTASIPVNNLAAPLTAIPGGSDVVLPGTGTNGAFTLPAAGTYSYKLPQTFNVTVQLQDGIVPSLSGPCTMDQGGNASFGSADVVAPTGPQGEGYTCTVFGNALPIFVEGVAPTLTSPTAGQKVAAGKVPVSTNVTLAAAVADTLKQQTGATAVGFDSSDFALGLGSSSIPVNGLTASKVTIPGGADVVMPGAGSNGAFTLPSAGTYSYELPSTFNINLQLENGVVPTLSGPCTLDAGGTAAFGSVDVAQATKVASTTKATAPKSVKKGAAAKIAVSVTPGSATGKVTAKEGSKSLGTAVLKSGKASITVKGLKPGKHTIVVSYAGDSLTKASTAKAIKVTVKKK